MSWLEIKWKTWATTRNEKSERMNEIGKTINNHELSLVYRVKVEEIDREYECMLIYAWVFIFCENVRPMWEAQRSNKIKYWTKKKWNERERDRERWTESGFQVKSNIGLLPVVCISFLQNFKYLSPVFLPQHWRSRSLFCFGCKMIRICIN